jgi:chromosomal replication initiator protein
MDLDPRLTFESFVVGPANRLAAAAARRAAEHPGRSYNPLFLYSPSGLGKSHILSAIAHLSLRHHPERLVVYQPVEIYLGELTRALGKGEGREFQERYAMLDILLLDDVQFLAGQGQAQEMLLRTLDGISSRGGQVVLASDRPPAEIDRLDERLLSRFSGGLIVDMGQPDLETRVAILRRKAQERNGGFEAGVAEALARLPFGNVRELQGAMNRVLVVQELEGRMIPVQELSRVVGSLPGGSAEGSDLSFEVEPEWRREVREAADAAEAEGVESRRLRRLLERADAPTDWKASIEAFHRDLERSREIERELEALGNPWPEAAATLLRDPDRIDESEGLLASARERARPFDELPPGPRLDELQPYFPQLALRAADRLLTADRPDYNPLYLHASDPNRVHVFLEGVGRTHQARDQEARIGYISVAEFAEEFIRAIGDGVAGAWRERWWAVEVLLLHGLESLARTERAQEEVFHLFEALKRRDARIILAADRMPSELQKVDDRLISRFEGGLVVDLGGPELPDSMVVRDRPAAPAEPPSPPVDFEDVWAETSSAAADDGNSVAMVEKGAVDDMAALRELAGVGRARSARADERSLQGDGESDLEGSPPLEAPWMPSRERVVWDWPSVSERIVEEP